MKKCDLTLAQCVVVVAKVVKVAVAGLAEALVDQADPEAAVLEDQVVAVDSAVLANQAVAAMLRQWWTE